MKTAEEWEQELRRLLSTPETATTKDVITFVRSIQADAMREAARVVENCKVLKGVFDPKILTNAIEARAEEVEEGK